MFGGKLARETRCSWVQHLARPSKTNRREPDAWRATFEQGAQAINRRAVDQFHCAGNNRSKAKGEEKCNRGSGQVWKAVNGQYHEAKPIQQSGSPKFSGPAPQKRPI